MNKPLQTRVVIIEDEQPASQLIESMLTELRPDWQIEVSLESIASAVKWLQTNPEPELAFVDIQLSDGLSFEIFDQIDYEGMIIFTTAYDEYALRAFQVNSIDYLLKPIRKKDLEQAIEKYENWQIQDYKKYIEKSDLNELLRKFTEQEPIYRSRFLIKRGDSFVIIPATDIAYFNTYGHQAMAVMQDGSKHVVDFTLDELEDQLEPAKFFRISRQMIVKIDAIHKIHRLFNGRLGIDLIPRYDDKATVSRQRVRSFKEWIDR